jgi:hydrogenase maturation protein HypF
MAAAQHASHKRLKLCIRGAIQGVGFRPFVFRLATELGLSGWVNNSAQGVFIEIEGAQSALESFRHRLETEKPPRSFIQSLEASWLDTAGYTGFEIRESVSGGTRTALVLPDIATCPDCLHEIFTPGDRRYFYPFTNCTNCGPRFSIIEALPYDRANTSMKAFKMCPECQREYDDPRNRRFHAQPNACPVCGPHLELWDRAGKILADGATRRAKRGAFKRQKLQRSIDAEVLNASAEAIRTGKILAIKGLGGFHLIVAAHEQHAVQRLRELKHREEKPFALMFPSIVTVKGICEVSNVEERLLLSPECPIVLLRRLSGALHGPRTPPLASSIAPGNPNLGVMLPYTPLHHLLLSLLGFPVVATSGNLSDEPICINEREAIERLGAIADLFMVHNRPIARHVDDSIVRVMAGREMVVRRARGLAPLPIDLRVGEEVKNLRSSSHSTILAVGAHLKNAIALGVGPQVFISQHVGDLETDLAFGAFQQVIADFEKLYETKPAVVAADAHPDYLATKFARELATAPVPPDPSPVTPQLILVQHHLAHVLSCMGDNELEAPALGVSWDGTGYGLDGTIWGGEFLLVESSSWERFAHLRQFRLPGGDKAVREPRRSALGLLYEVFGEEVVGLAQLAPVLACSAGELVSIKTMLARRLNSPLTSSVGRLFDAVASLAGLRHRVRFEGQAAMELEFVLEGIGTNEPYPFEITKPKLSKPESQSPASPGPLDRPGSALMPHAPGISPSLQIDWSPLVHALLADLKDGVSAGHISARFHNGLVESILAVARRAGQSRVVLSGGCFQNRYLTERAVQRLQSEGFRPYWHQRVPPNDGGIALGQVVAARRYRT